MWTFIVGFLVGGLIFGVLGFLFVNSKEKKTENKKTEPKYTRRGIYSNDYMVGLEDNKKKVIVQFEVGELESTNDKSKVIVISLVTNNSACNNTFDKQKISEMLNNTWLLSTDIEWINDTSKTRNDKIDQLLNK